jgi:hypothetical protein
VNIEIVEKCEQIRPTVFAEIFRLESAISSMPGDIHLPMSRSDSMTGIIKDFLLKCARPHSRAIISLEPGRLCRKTTRDLRELFLLEESAESICEVGLSRVHSESDPTLTESHWNVVAVKSLRRVKKNK